MTRRIERRHSDPGFYEYHRPQGKFSYPDVQREMEIRHGLKWMNLLDSKWRKFVRDESEYQPNARWNRFTTRFVYSQLRDEIRNQLKGVGSLSPVQTSVKKRLAFAEEEKKGVRSPPDPIKGPIAPGMEKRPPDSCFINLADTFYSQLNDEDPVGGAKIEKKESDKPISQNQIAPQVFASKRKKSSQIENRVVTIAMVVIAVYCIYLGMANSR